MFQLCCLRVITPSRLTVLVVFLLAFYVGSVITVAFVVRHFSTFTGSRYIDSILSWLNVHYFYTRELSHVGIFLDVGNGIAYTCIEALGFIGFARSGMHNMLPSSLPALQWLS